MTKRRRPRKNLRKKGPAKPPNGQLPSDGPTQRNAATGRFLPGNTARLTHGQRSARAANALLPEQEAIRALLKEREAELLSDLGGVDLCGQVKRDGQKSYQRCWVLEETLWADIERNGALTAKGRQRAAMDALLKVMDRRVRLGLMLGLERRTKRIAGNALDYFDQERQQQPAPPEETT